MALLKNFTYVVTSLFRLNSTQVCVLYQLKWQEDGRRERDDPIPWYNKSDLNLCNIALMLWDLYNKSIKQPVDYNTYFEEPHSQLVSLRKLHPVPYVNCLSK